MLIVPELLNDQADLVPLSQSHSSGMFALWSDPHVCQYSGPVADYDGNPITTPVTTSADSDLIIDFWLRAATDGWGFRWAIMHKGDRDEACFAGTVGFNALGQRAEIAWHLLPAFWGQGIMSAAVRRSMAWLADTGCQELEAYVEDRNFESIALAERMGMRTSGHVSDGANQYLMRLRR